MKRLTKIFTLVSLFLLSLILVVSCVDKNSGNKKPVDNNKNNNQGELNKQDDGKKTDNEEKEKKDQTNKVPLSKISENKKYLKDSFIERNINYKRLLEEKKYSSPVNTKILLYQDQIPFIGVNNYLNMLKDSIDLGSKEIKSAIDDKGIAYKYQYYVDYKFENNIGTISFNYKEFSNGKEEELKNTITFDSKSDKVIFSDLDLLNKIEKQEEIQEGDENQVASRIKFTNEEVQTPKNEIIKKKEFNLSDFDLDLLSYNNEDVYVPVALLNQILLANSYFKVYYNGDNLLGFDLNTIDNRLDDSLYYLDKEQMTQELKEFDYNLLRFAFKEFYGLEKRTVNGKTYNDYERLLKEQRFLFQTNSNLDYKDGVSNIIYGLDDLHAQIAKEESFYFTIGLNDEEQENKGAHLIDTPRTDNYINAQKEVEKLNKIAKKSDEEFDDNTYNDLEVTYTKDQKTAIITFDGFDENTTNALVEKFEEIKQMKTVKNVVFNLMNNGGGIVGVMFETLGFMTDKPFDTYVHDKLTNRKVKTTVQSLVGKQNYKFFLFTSGVTFSSGNLLTQLFKENKLGKVIGQKTGGGASSITPILLQSGLYVQFSSKDNKTDKNYKDTEYGIEPDIKKPLKELFNLDKVQEIINSLSK